MKVLLMGGQACVLYGAAEFSKDLDLVLLLEEDNLLCFQRFIAELQAEVIAVPPFEREYLRRGHAVHFRAQAPGFAQLRIDIMSKLRGVAPFPQLWNRRSTVELLPELTVDLLSLPDLVSAKKTQRDKDWPMIRRLVDVDYLRSRAVADTEQVRFWLRELRSPALLIEGVSHWPELAAELQPIRTDVISAARQGDASLIENALYLEQRKERAEDRDYWQPLIRELEALRHKQRN